MKKPQVTIRWFPLETLETRAGDGRSLGSTSKHVFPNPLSFLHEARRDVPTSHHLLGVIILHLAWNIGSPSPCSIPKKSSKTRLRACMVFYCQ